MRLAEGGELDSGALRLTALWPPPRARSAPAVARTRTALCLVLLAEWRHFSILLTGDAEAEAAPIDPGPVDVLKVAHHGIATTPGSTRLLDHTAPSWR